MAALHGQPRAAVALLRQHLRPSQRVDEKELTALLADLDSPKFAVRLKAVKALADLGERIEGALRQVLAGKPTLEVRRSALSLLEKLDDGRSDLLRAARAVELLEQLGTPEARALLRELAGGESAARLTRQASEALRRLADR
jgi:HEAT repeat protein